MASQTDMHLIQEIATKYGSVIDLEETPAVLAEILRVYGTRFAAGTLAKGSGGVMAGTIAGSDGGVGCERVRDVRRTGGEAEATMSEVMRGILRVQRDVDAMNVELKRLASTKLKPKTKVSSKMKS